MDALEAILGQEIIYKQPENPRCPYRRLQPRTWRYGTRKCLDRQFEGYGTVPRIPITITTMKIRKWSVFFALFAACLLSVYAQAPLAETDSVFAPFPSQLRVAVKEGLVVLGWADSPNVKSGYARLSQRGAHRCEELSFSSSPSRGRLRRHELFGLERRAWRVLLCGPRPSLRTVSAYPVFIPARNTTATSLKVEAPALAIKASAQPTEPVESPRLQPSGPRERRCHSRLIQSAA